MATIRVGALLNGTADVFAVMLLALFESVANTFALQIVDRIHFLCRHHL